MLFTNLLHVTLNTHLAKPILHCVSLLMRSIVFLTPKRSMNYFKWCGESHVNNSKLTANGLKLGTGDHYGLSNLNTYFT